MLIRRRDALKHDGAHVLRVLAQVNHGRARAVRPAKEIDLFVTQRGAHFVEVVGRDRGCVKRQVSFRFEFSAALADLVEREKVTEITLRILWIVKLTVEGIRLSGAALVHEDEIAMLAYLCECTSESRRIFSRGGSRSTRKVEKGIWFALLTCRRQDEDVDVDLPSLARRAVFEDLVRAALRRPCN